MALLFLPLSTRSIFYSDPTRCVFNSLHPEVLGKSRFAAELQQLSGNVTYYYLVPILPLPPRAPKRSDCSMDAVSLAPQRIPPAWLAFRDHRAATVEPSRLRLRVENPLAR